MNSWADNLRAAIEGLTDYGFPYDSNVELMLQWLHTGERHIDSCLNTIEALAEANADLRRQLHELKAAHENSRN